jgi:hypothetical protein
MQVIQRNFQEIQLLLVRLSMVTQKQVQLLQRAAPMKTYGNHNYQNQNQLLILHLFAIILLLEIKPIPIA